MTGTRSGGERRRQVPSHTPVPGADNATVEAGGSEPGQKHHAGRETSLNPNQDEVISEFWAHKNKP